MTPLDPDVAPASSLVAFALTRAGRLLLRCGAPDHWHPAAGYTLIPCELPGAALPTGADLTEGIPRLASRLLGKEARVRSSAMVYGPSPSHRIDRLPSGGERIAPLLRFARLAPASAGDSASDKAPREQIVRVYLVTLPPALWFPTAPGMWLWLSEDGLRHAMRGLPFAELLAMPQVEWRTPPATLLPSDAFAYAPSEYGERHLLRILAKYGHAAVFQPDQVQGDRPSG